MRAFKNILRITSQGEDVITIRSYVLSSPFPVKIALAIVYAANKIFARNYVHQLRLESKNVTIPKHIFSLKSEKNKTVELWPKKIQYSSRKKKAE